MSAVATPAEVLIPSEIADIDSWMEALNGYHRDGKSTSLEDVVKPMFDEYDKLNEELEKVAPKIARRDALKAKIGQVYQAVIVAAREMVRAEPFDGPLLEILKAAGGWKDMQDKGAADADIRANLLKRAKVENGYSDKDTGLFKKSDVIKFYVDAKWDDEPVAEGNALVGHTRRLLKIPAGQAKPKPVAAAKAPAAKKAAAPKKGASRAKTVTMPKAKDANADDDSEGAGVGFRPQSFGQWCATLKGIGGPDVAKVPFNSEDREWLEKQHESGKRPAETRDAWKLRKQPPTSIGKTASGIEVGKLTPTKAREMQRVMGTANPARMNNAQSWGKWSPRFAKAAGVVLGDLNEQHAGRVVTLFQEGKTPGEAAEIFKTGKAAAAAPAVEKHKPRPEIELKAYQSIDDVPWDADTDPPDARDLEESMNRVKLYPPSPTSPPPKRAEIDVPFRMADGHLYAIITARHWNKQGTPTVSYTLRRVTPANEWEGKQYLSFASLPHADVSAPENVSLEGLLVSDDAGDEWILHAAREQLWVDVPDESQRRLTSDDQAFVIMPAHKPLADLSTEELQSRAARLRDIVVRAGQDGADTTTANAVRQIAQIEELLTARDVPPPAASKLIEMTDHPFTLQQLRRAYTFDQLSKGKVKQVLVDGVNNPWIVTGHADTEQHDRFVLRAVNEASRFAGPTFTYAQLKAKALPGRPPDLTHLRVTDQAGREFVLIDSGFDRQITIPKTPAAKAG